MTDEQCGWFLFYSSKKLSVKYGSKRLIHLKRVLKRKEWHWNRAFDIHRIVHINDSLIMWRYAVIISYDIMLDMLSRVWIMGWKNWKAQKHWFRKMHAPKLICQDCKEINKVFCQTWLYTGFLYDICNMLKDMYCMYGSPERPCVICLIFSCHLKIQIFLWSWLIFLICWNTLLGAYTIHQRVF